MAPSARSSRCTCWTECARRRSSPKAPTTRAPSRAISQRSRPGHRQPRLLVAHGPVERPPLSGFRRREHGSRPEHRRALGRGSSPGSTWPSAPKFLTTFSLNCVGQYVDVLALGGAALVVLAAPLEDEALHGSSARLHYLGLGLLLGAAFWQQPVALVYVLAALGALALRPATCRDPWTLLVGAGLVVGALPVLLWNLQNGWGSSDILGRDPGELMAQAEALPALVARTLGKAFPILAGLSPGHPASGLPGIRALCNGPPAPDRPGLCRPEHARARGELPRPSFRGPAAGAPRGHDPGPLLGHGRRQHQQAPALSAARTGRLRHHAGSGGRLGLDALAAADGRGPSGRVRTERVGHRAAAARERADRDLLAGRRALPGREGDPHRVLGLLRCRPP